ncbi:MAG: hypothetical protein ACYTGH_08835 [Planctomycetota bacterium]|jgi:hypothetical protein
MMVDLFHIQLRQWLGAFLLVALLVLPGCFGPVLVCKVNTVIYPDRSTHRAAEYSGVIPRERGQAPIPFPLKQVLHLPKKEKYESWKEAKGFLAFAGTFVSPEAVPVDFTKVTPGSDLWSQNRITMDRRNYVLFQVFDFEEAIDDIVEREEGDEALREGVALITETLVGVLDSRFGAEYDLSGFNRWLRIALPDLSRQLYQSFWEIRRSRRGPTGSPPSEVQEWEARVRKDLARFGLEMGPLLSRKHREANEAQLWALLEAQLKAGVVPRNGETPALTVAFFQDRENQQALLKHLEASLTKQYGSVGDFMKRINPLIPVVLGAYFGKRVTLLQSVPTFQFHYRLRLPGSIIQSNGTRDLDGSLLWRFDHGRIMLTGHRMWARSLAVNEKALKQLQLHGFPGSIEMVERFHVALAGKKGVPDVRLLRLLAACVEAGSLKPLQDAALPGRRVAGLHPERVRGLLGVIGAYYRPGVPSPASSKPLAAPVPVELPPEPVATPVEPPSEVPDPAMPKEEVFEPEMAPLSPPAPPTPPPPASPQRSGEGAEAPELE